VWQDGRNGNKDIYMYNLSTFTETQITTNEIDQYSPAIYGNRIVWTNERNLVNSDIYMYNLSTKNQTRITTSGKAYNPKIYGDRIVWEDYRNDNAQDWSNPDIYMYDLSTSKETQITTDKSNQDSPAIYGNKIVWDDDSNGNYDIYVYDISTSKKTQITANESNQAFPAIYGDRIVWQDMSNGNTDIYMYNLSTSKETQITTDKSNQDSPAIYRDKIVWQDERNEESNISDGDWHNIDIYMYDLSTSTETQVTTNGSIQWDPAIYDDWIVWRDDPKHWGDISNIYICTISGNGSTSKPPVANFTSNVISGNAPLKVTFTDKSTGLPNVWTWDFGDGDNSTEQNPMHTYSAAGNYTVMLTASNENGTDAKTSEINVQSNSSQIPAGFNSLLFVMIVLYLFKKST
jgi:beta propeller repeat protein